jgi:hypothetical protein
VITLAVAVLALVVSVAALILAVAVARQSGAVASALQRHRSGHFARDGVEDPAQSRTERRQLNLGPPRATGERRASPGQLLPPEDSWTGPQPAVAPDGARTSAMPAARPSPPRLPRPGEIGRTR